MSEEEKNQRHLLKELTNIRDEIDKEMHSLWLQIQVVSPKEAEPILIRLINKLKKTSEPLIYDLEQAWCELEYLDQLYTVEEFMRGKKYPKKDKRESNE